jgi:hypothetical protein
VSTLSTDIKRLLGNISTFSQFGSVLKLRHYQQAVAEAVLDSVINCRGDTFVVMFPRQSGKNELQAQIETYLLVLFSEMDAEMVKVSPTLRPQTENAMRRLERVLRRNALARYFWKKEYRYTYRIGSARIYFFSGSNASSVVGATATHLLECDEAQDVTIAKWDKDFAPMAASRNATCVFWGTAWTSKTLLARELRAARQLEAKDGRQRAFVLTADEVRQEVSEYGVFVDKQVARLGRNHPMVRTQYYSEEIDSEGGMFPAERQALMRGSHPPLTSPAEAQGSIYCLLLDVAGEDESGPEGENDLPKNAGSYANFHDRTALTVVEVDLSTLSDELVQAPSYRIVDRRQWTGVKHTVLYSQVLELAQRWSARYLVVDATGVGAGLTSFLDKALPGKVIPYVFSSKSKSDLGWSFLAVIETNRYKEYSVRESRFENRNSSSPTSLDSRFSNLDLLQQIFWQQVEYCQSHILDGPGKVMRWGVPRGCRDLITGEFVHDDLLVSAALVSVLDTLPWGLGHSSVAPAPELFKEMRDAY